MSSPADVEKYLNDSELTLANLPELFGFLTEDEPEVSDYAVEALENCGAPSMDRLPFLNQECVHGSGLVQYWACALVARMVEDGALDLSQPVASQTVDALHSLIGNETVDLAVREKALLVFTHADQVGDATVDLLKVAKAKAPPRMSRLIDQILTQNQN